MKGSIYRSVEAGDRIGEKKLAREGTREWCYMYSVLSFTCTGKGLSSLKKHLKSKPHADQNQDKDVKLWT